MNDFSKHILRWYHKAHRKLPWRATKDPYKIWLSEIILQQTRVDQGMEYYLRFVDTYPEVKDLAQADEAEVLKLWQGLGYYSRARNLLHAARQVMDDHDGVFPDNYDSLTTLKGVGDYTAAAIASIAFGEVVPVVDGNVKRVVARISGVKETGQALYRQVKEKMETLINHHEAGNFNQAVMEFGALQCVPQNPACSECVFKDSCYAYKNDMVKILPLKEKKAKIKSRYFSYLVINDTERDRVALKKRTGDDIWKNLYEFPLIETDKEINSKALIKHPDFANLCGEGAIITEKSATYKHQLSHRTIYARFYEVKPRIEEHAEWKLISKDEFDKYPVSRLIEGYLEDYR